MVIAQVGPYMRKTCQPLSRVLILAQHDIAAIRFEFKGLFGYETGNRRSTYPFNWWCTEMSDMGGCLGLKRLMMWVSLKNRIPMGPPNC